MNTDSTNPAADTAATTVAAILNAHGLSLDDIAPLCSGCWCVSRREAPG